MTQKEYYIGMDVHKEMIDKKSYIFKYIIGDINMAFWIIFIIMIAILIELLIGYAIGNSVSQETGVILGIILIILGFSIIIGVMVIVCSRNNKKTVDVNLNINLPQNNVRNITPSGINNYLDTNENRQKYLSLDQNTNDNKKCPFCAEIIKREAIVCRFCGRDVPKEKAVDIEIKTENDNNASSVDENKKMEIERLEKLFDSTSDENEKAIIAKKLYDLGKLYYWRFIQKNR
jgi:uncharacterized membrane protein (DUF485 family)